MASGWRLLRPSSNDPNIPPLLVKYDFGKSNYKIWLTDLTRVWVETLNQRPLVQRAWELEADIDPIESDQRQMLLQRIQDSLDEVKGTKLAISTKDHFNGIVLTACSPLPKPLKPLQWPFYLAPSSGATLTNELVLPLLVEQLLFRKKVASLLATLQDKDHVISKLTDKMQAEGIELGKVFPGAVTSKFGRKATSKEDIGKSVQGLGSFNEHQWQSSFMADPDVPGSCLSLLSQLFSQGGSLSLLNFNEQCSDKAWWENISAECVPMDDESEGILQSHSQSPTANEFQRQPTPDHLDSSIAKGRSLPKEMTLPQRGSNPKPSAQETMDDGSTTETSDEDLDSVQSKPQGSQQGSKPMMERSSSPDSISSKPTNKASQDQLPKPRGMLGRIGRASKPSLSPSKPKLGKIGGISNAGKSPKPASKSPEPRARSPVRRKSPSPQRETSQERADRKREQLKRELEEKSRHGVKKKRKSEW